MSDVNVRRDGKPATASDPTLSGQQMQAMAARYAEELGKIRKDIELRKWVLDRATDKHDHPDAAIAYARALHAFLVEGAVDKTV